MKADNKYNVNRSFEHEDMLCAISFAIGELCKLAKANKDNTGLMCSVAALIQKLEHEQEKVEKRKKKLDNVFYSLT